MRFGDELFLFFLVFIRFLVQHGQKNIVQVIVDNRIGVILHVIQMSLFDLELVENPRFPKVHDCKKKYWIMIRFRRFMD